MIELIKNTSLLREDYRLNEGLIEYEVDLLAGEIAAIDESAIVALVGDYGAGKSTSLYRIRENDTDDSHRWLQFDAWRYPERKGLWDGLIIEIAQQLGLEKKVTRKIEGNKSLIGKWGGVIGEAFTQFGDFLPKTDVAKIEVDPKVAVRAAKISQKAEEIFGKSPAKRAYELERILADVLVSIKENVIYIIVEDIDRSGSDGVNFLETLNYFIKNNEQLKGSGKKMIIIAPIGKAAYSKEIESFYKCTDLVLDYRPSVKSAEQFVKSIFTSDALGGNSVIYINNISAFMAELLSTPGYDMNIRKLKAIIRQVNQRYKSLSSRYKNVDWRAVLVIESMRAIHHSSSPEKSLLDGAMSSSGVSGGTMFAALLYTIYTPNQPIFTYKYANSDKKEDRLVNPNALSYRFTDYDGQGDVSVWQAHSWDDRSPKGYMADYYIS